MQRILYIEDSKLERTMMRHILETQYEVLEAENGLQGLELVRTAPLDLVLVDLNMPGMDGNEVTTRLKTLFPQMPVVVITAETTPGTRESALAAGCAGFIIKPVSAEELLKQIAGFLEGDSEELPPAERLVYQQAYQQKLAAKLEHQVHQLAKTNQELRAVQERLIKAERYRALAQLVRGVAHDFNNVLTIIMGNLSMVMQEIEDEMIREDLLAIQKAAEDGEEMVQRICLFSPFEPGGNTREPIEVTELIQDTIMFTKPRWNNPMAKYSEMIRITTELEEPFTVWGNPRELREVLVNLIFNAVDAMPEGGEIRFKTKCTTNKGYIIVSDTGEGMSAEIRQRVFEPFFTTKGHNGTGLGLFTSYGIILRHNGVINLESELGKGTTVTIALPVHDS